MKKIFPLKHGIQGEIRIPGDKSISHRSVILSSLGTSDFIISNFLFGADCLNTVSCLRLLGIEIKQFKNELLVHGRGLHGLQEPKNVLNAGNSGTTLRLLIGLLAPQKFFTTFTGDNSLRRRPMGRVIEPLNKMGALIFGRNQNKNLPIAILPAAKKLQGITYEMPVASAQVKSAILLAGLYSETETVVIEPIASRDHTERMLQSFGVNIEKSVNTIKLFPTNKLNLPKEIFIPGDISSAAYWLVLATILKNSNVIIKDVGINETRIGIVNVLKRMGVKIEFINERTSVGESFADLQITTPENLKGVKLGKEIIPQLIDEIPIIAVAAAFAEGVTIIRDVEELRFKETDRLKAIVEEFNKISPGTFQTNGNDLIIIGRKEKKFASCKTFGDHRIAMSLSIFGAASNGVELDDAECVNISYPNFFEVLFNEKNYCD